MNRKFILFSSILIVAIGIIGILMGSEDNDKKSDNLINLNKEKEITIKLVRATRDLSSGMLLTPNDYIIKKTTVLESSQLIKNDLTTLTNINGYLLKTNIINGSYITKDMLISPDSDEFMHQNLKNGHIVYKFNINKQNEYLLDTLNIGDEISIQLRTLETDKSKGFENSTTVMASHLNDRKKQSYSLSEIIQNIKVIRIKKYSENELSEKNSKNQKTEDMFTGYISIIMKTEDLDLMHIVEKAGDIFLTPSYTHDKDNIRPKNLYDILPTLRTIRELRG